MSFSQGGNAARKSCSNKLNYNISTHNGTYCCNMSMLQIPPPPTQPCSNITQFCWWKLSLPCLFIWSTKPYYCNCSYKKHFRKRFQSQTAKNSDIQHSVSPNLDYLLRKWCSSLKVLPNLFSHRQKNFSLQNLVHIHCLKASKSKNVSKNVSNFLILTNIDSFWFIFSSLVCLILLRFSFCTSKEIAFHSTTLLLTYHKTPH